MMKMEEENVSGFHKIEHGSSSITENKSSCNILKVILAR